MATVTEPTRKSNTRPIEPKPGGRFVVRITREPFPRIKPGVERSNDEIRPDVRALMGGLLAGRAPWPCLLWGGPGRGKTLASWCIHDRVPSAAYTTAARLMSMTDRFQPSAKAWDAHIRQAGLVIVDELGRFSHANDGHQRAHEAQTLLEAIDLFHGRPVLFVSNLDPDTLGKYYQDSTGRLMSRLTAGTVFKHEGPDRRRAS